MRRPPRLLHPLPLTAFCIAAVLCAFESRGDGPPEALRERLERRAEQRAQGLERYDEPMAAARFERDRRAAVDGRRLAPAERYRAALERMERMPRFSTRLGQRLPSLAEARARGSAGEARLGAWEAIGPGNIGGRTRALAVDPGDPSILYAGGVAGGVWKSTDAGTSWRPLDDAMANLAVVSLAMDPADPRVLYAGTGEGFTSSVLETGVHSTGLSFRGAGIFKTTDAGASWSRLESTLGADFRYVSDLVISSGSSQRLYAATSTGVFRSRNGGRDWTQVLDPEVLGGCLDLVQRTDVSRDYLFAACGTFESATVYRSTNANSRRRWQAVLSEEAMGRTSLAIAPSRQRTIYALSSSLVPGPGGNYENGLHAVFRSKRAGKAGSWKAQVRNRDGVKLNTLLLTNPVIATLADCGFDSENEFSSLGWWANVIAVDPRDPNVVWAGGVDLFRSDDGGRSWGLASHWWPDPSTPQYLHADKHAVVFHPAYDGAANQTLWVASDGGVARTDNARAPVARGAQATCQAGSSGIFWRALNRGYQVTQFYHGAPFPDGRSYLGGTQDNGTLAGSDAAGSDGWRELLGGDGAYVAIDPRNPSVVYASTQRLGLRKSLDGGASFTPAISGISDDADDFLFIVPYVMDPSAPDRLWIGGKRLWRTDDGAFSWSPASRPLSDEAKVSALAVAPSDSDRVLVGLTDGQLFRHERATTTGAGSRWDGVQPREGYVTSLAFDPSDEDVVYATYGGFGGAHVWRSGDGGESWSSLDGTGPAALPDVPVLSIAVDPADSRRLYLGTDLGVFTSDDRGQSWAVENTGFANVVTETVTVLRKADGSRELFAFTHGRSAWRVPIADD